MPSRSNIAPISRNAYVLLRSRHEKRARYVAVALPASIGSSSQNDVIVNAASIAPQSRILYADGSRLKVKEASTHLDLPLASLSDLGIQAIGPIRGVPSVAQGPLGSLKAIAAREGQMFGRLAPLTRSVLGGFLPQPLRLMSWLAVAVFAVRALTAEDSAAGKVRDLSTTPLPLAWEQVLSGEIQTFQGNPEYAQGVSFTVTAGAAGAQENGVLRFELAGLDQPGAVVVAVNGRDLYRSDMDPSCLDHYCPEHVLLPRGTLKEGVNLVAIRHRTLSSPYGVRKLVIHALRPFDPETQEVLRRSLTLAQRRYEEREIVTENLIAAKREISKVLSLLDTHTGLDDVRASAGALATDIAKAYDAKVSDLQFKAEREARLANFGKAKEYFRALLLFFPDPNAAEHEQIIANIKRLEELER